MSGRPIETIETVELGAPSPRSGIPLDAEAYALESSLRSLVSLGAATSERSLQTAVGASEIGNACDRNLVFKLAGTRPSNLTDPLRSLVGMGFHLVMADMFRRLDAGSGRFLVEEKVRYRGVPGTLDLFDRLTCTVTDWKTTLKAKLGKLRADGPQARHVVQLQVYGAALALAGETVRWVSLAFVPVDATLDEMWVWRTAYDPRVADEAVERLNRLHREQVFESASGQAQPSTVEARPDALCRWCDYHNAGATDLDLACPGADERKPS